MKVKISNYRNLPGEHCGSTAMRNLLFYYCGLELSEAVIFGLGSGIESIFIKIDDLDPAVTLFGRSISMEADAAVALGIDYQEQPEMDNQKAWDDVKAEVSEGRPTMLTGDIFFLDYREFKYRFPAHRFVLLGFDDKNEVAYVADRIEPDSQECSYQALAESRNPKTGITTFNLWGKFFDTSVNHSFEEACLAALLTTMKRMTGKDTSQADLIKSVTGDSAVVKTGTDGLFAYGQDLLSWHERKDASKLASYASQSIEKFGTGGGNFRKLYAGFLDWAVEIVPDIVSENHAELAYDSSRTWTSLSEMLNKASNEPEKIDIWKQASDKAMEIKDIESELFESLAENL